MKGLLSAAAAAPFIAALSGDLAVTAFFGSEFGWATSIGCFVGYPVVIAIGLPLFSFMRKQNWMSPRAFIAAGITLSLLALGIGSTILNFYGSPNPLELAVKALAYISVTGTVGATVFRNLLSEEDLASPQSKPTYRQ